jgi:hypothetical protein
VNYANNIEIQIYFFRIVDINDRKLLNGIFFEKKEKIKSPETCLLDELHHQPGLLISPYILDE